MGTRMGDANSIKCFRKINQKKLLEIQLEVLEDSGIKEIAIVIGHMKNEFISSIGTNYKSIKINYIINDLFDKSGSAFSLFCTSEYWHNKPRAVLILHADILYERRIMLNFLKNTSENQNTILLDAKYKVLTNDEQTVLGSDNKVNNIVKGLTSYKNVVGESLGINYFSVNFMNEYYSFLAKLFKTNNIEYNWEQTIERFLENNKEIDLFYSDIGNYSWINVNYVEDLEEAALIGNQINGQIYEK